MWKNLPDRFTFLARTRIFDHASIDRARELGRVRATSRPGGKSRIRCGRVSLVVEDQSRVSWRLNLLQELNNSRQVKCVLCAYEHYTIVGDILTQLIFL